MWLKSGDDGNFSATLVNRTNFFDRTGYDANPVVRQRTGAELLARIDELMTTNLQKPGAREFQAAFGG